MSDRKRSTVDWSKHELKVTEYPGVLIHDLKRPGESFHRVTFINTHGVLAVTGDWYNWIFCREFHPSKEGRVSDSYWCEKLRTASNQDPYLFDEEATKAELLERSLDLEYSKEQREYFDEMISEVDEGKEIYLYRAHMNLPKGLDHESVVYRKRIDYSLECVFDAFDEICSRLSSEAIRSLGKEIGQ